MKRQMKARAHIKTTDKQWSLYVIYQTFPLIPTQKYPGFQAVKNYCSFLSEETNENFWPEGKHSTPPLSLSLSLSLSHTHTHTQTHTHTHTHTHTKEKKKKKKKKKEGAITFPI